MQHKSDKYVKALGPNSGQSAHVFVAAQGHPNDLRLGQCAVPLAVVKEPNGQLCPTSTCTWVRIPAHNKGEGPAPINGVHWWWKRLNVVGPRVLGPTTATSGWVVHDCGGPQL